MAQTTKAVIPVAGLGARMLTMHILILQLLVAMSYLKKSGNYLNLLLQVQVVKYS
jgi:hypothetical protein